MTDKEFKQIVDQNGFVEYEINYDKSYGTSKKEI